MRTLLAIFAVALVSVPSAQTPAPAPAPAALPAASTSDAQTYSYEPDGRRDPFLNLLGTGTEARVDGKHTDGAAGLTVGEISVRGVMQSRGTLLAMVQGADTRTYVVHQGDKLADGVVKTVTPQGLVIVQDVNDPLSLVKQREVRKLLRSLEDGK